MRKIFVFLVLVITGYAGLQLYQNDMNFKAVIFNVPFLQGTARIDLRSFSGFADIPLNTGTLILRDGKTDYVFKKERLWENKIFTVTASNFPETTWGGQVDQGGGYSYGGIYAAAVYVLPGDVKVLTEGSYEQMKPMTLAVKAQILPANRQTRENSAGLTMGRLISVSGIQFKKDKELYNGRSVIYPEQAAKDIMGLRLFYLFDIKIKGFAGGTAAAGLPEYKVFFYSCPRV